MAVLRANASYTLTTTDIKHVVVLVERGTNSSGQAKNCSEQCKAVQAMQEVESNAQKTRTLLYFACGDGDNSNWDDATSYKTRTDKFNCNDCMLIELICSSILETIFSKYWFKI